MSYILTLVVLLVIRTYMSIWLADVNGRVVKAIVKKDLHLFIKRVSLIQKIIRFSFCRFLPFSYLRCLPVLLTQRLTTITKNLRLTSESA